MGFGQAQPALAQTLPQVIYSTTTAEDIITSYAIHYGISAQPLIDTLRCESNFDASVVGDKGTSFGVAQLHLPAHPDITKKQALDPLWSINWAAQQFAQGHQHLWSCFNKIYGNNSA